MDARSSLAGSSAPDGAPAASSPRRTAAIGPSIPGTITRLGMPGATTSSYGRTLERISPSRRTSRKNRRHDTHGPTACHLPAAWGRSLLLHGSPGGRTDPLGCHARLSGLAARSVTGAAGCLARDLGSLREAASHRVVRSTTGIVIRLLQFSAAYVPDQLSRPRRTASRRPRPRTPRRGGDRK